MARIPVAALAGVTAYVGICLLEWGTWRRLPKMRRVDAAAFLSAALLTMLWSPVGAVAVGCAPYAAVWAYERWRTAIALPDLEPANVND